MGRPALLTTLLLAALALWLVPSADANHIRGGTLEWEAVGDLQVEFGGRIFGKYDHGGWQEVPNVGARPMSATLSGTAGSVSVDFVVERVYDGGTETVTDDWFSAAMEPKQLSLSSANNSGEPWLMGMEIYARLATTEGHVNNGYDGGASETDEPEANMRLETAIDLAAGQSSPQVLFPPVVPCERDSVCSFKIPSIGHEDRAFRMSSDQEATGAAGGGGLPFLGGGSSFSQPGEGGFAQSPATIDANGTYRWDTTGAEDSSAAHTYYSTQVMLEDEHGKVPMDFFIELVDDLADRPYWVEDPCDATVVITPGVEVTIVRHATADVTTAVTVDVLGVPDGATVQRFVGGAPAEDGWASVTWTPAADEQDSILVFAAYSGSGAQAPACSITLEVDINDPPIADFSFDATRDWVGDIFQFTDLSDPVDDGDSIVNWTWELDGAVWSYDQNPTRSFDTVATHVVSLTVQDARGGSAKVSRPVPIVNAPPVADFLVPPEVTSGVQVVLEDNSTDAGINDRITTWTWRISGETGGGQSLVWTFTTPGRNSVCLEVEDTYGATGEVCKAVEVLNRPPSVAIEVVPGAPEGSSGVTYQLRCIVEDVDGFVDTCFWDFGDGTTAKGFDVAHEWAAARPAPYLVVARAIDDLGAAGSATTEVDIHNQAPFVRITYHREADDPIQRVRFESESYDVGGGEIEHAWDLGDGTQSSERSPVHEFADPQAVYRIELTVRDVEGAPTTGVLFVRPADLSGTIDSDGDGHPDDRDVCPQLADPDQRDSDGNGVGDLCDQDRDGDGVLNDADAFPDDPSEWVDTDGDGTGDEADADDDNDGLGDAEERALGTNPKVADSDGDGFTDREELSHQTNPLDPLSPDWRARDVRVESDGVRWLVSWAANDGFIEGFEVLVDGEVIATLGASARNITIIQEGAVQVRTLHAAGISDPLDAPAVQTVAPAPVEEGRMWPWFVGAGTVLAAGGAGAWLWRRRVS